jgi:GGDEF domain-containing protein
MSGWLRIGFALLNLLAPFAPGAAAANADAAARAWQHDAPTGLPNRRMFNGHLQRAISTYQRGQGGSTLLLIDLDGFKIINDCFGHAVSSAASPNPSHWPSASPP